MKISYLFSSVYGRAGVVAAVLTVVLGAVPEEVTESISPATLVDFPSNESEILADPAYNFRKRSLILSHNRSTDNHFE